MTKKEREAIIARLQAAKRPETQGARARGFNEGIEVATAIVSSAFKKGDKDPEEVSDDGKGV